MLNSIIVVGQTHRLLILILQKDNNINFVCLISVTKRKAKAILFCELLRKFWKWTNFFQNIGRGRTWVPLAQVLQNVCVTYLELNAKAAKAYFLTQTEAIKQLCLCLESPAAKILIDTIVCLNRIED